jgi:hypothetical protein
MENGVYRILRPLPARSRTAATSKVGWSPFLIDGHARWDVFELLGPQLADCQVPHLEDVWVRGLKPRNFSASPEMRRTILQATLAESGQPLFGEPLQMTRSGAYLLPGTRNRSLATVLLLGKHITFHGCRRSGAEGADIRVELNLGGLGGRQLPVKDHHLLVHAERSGPTLDGQLQGIRAAVSQVVRQQDGRIEVAMQGTALATRALRALTQAIQVTLEKHRLDVTDLRGVVVHGGNGRMPGLLAR